MKYRNKNTGEVVTAIQATRSGMHEIPGGVMYLDDGDWMVTRADGSVEGYQEAHPFWVDHDEIVETRVVEVNDGKAVTYVAERKTGTGWVRGTAKASQALAEADVPAKPVERVVKEFEGGVLKNELVVGDDPLTPEVETSFFRRVLNFIGLGD